MKKRVIGITLNISIKNEDEVEIPWGVHSFPLSKEVCDRLATIAYSTLAEDFQRILLEGSPSDIIYMQTTRE